MGSFELYSVLLIEAVFWISLKRSESNFDDNYRFNFDYGFARGGAGVGEGRCLAYLHY